MSVQSLLRKQSTVDKLSQHKLIQINWRCWFIKEISKGLGDVAKILCIYLCICNPLTQH